MEHVDKALGNINRYFDILGVTGHYDDKKTFALLLYSFLVNEVFTGPLSDYLDDNGLSVFLNMFRCLPHDPCMDFSISDVCHISEPRNTCSVYTDLPIDLNLDACCE